ncbi:unnamed protein product, partial [Prorocentrum cordatum]
TTVAAAVSAAIRAATPPGTAPQPPRPWATPIRPTAAILDGEVVARAPSPPPGSWSRPAAKLRSGEEVSEGGDGSIGIEELEAAIGVGGRHAEERLARGVVRGGPEEREEGEEGEEGEEAQEAVALGRGSGLSKAVHFELADGDGEYWFDGDGDGALFDWYDGKKKYKGKGLAAVPPFPTLEGTLSHRAGELGHHGGVSNRRGGELVQRGGELGQHAGEPGHHGGELDHRGGELVQCGGELGHRAGERGHHAGVLDPRGGLVQRGGELGHRAGERGHHAGEKDPRGGELVQRGGGLGHRAGELGLHRGELDHHGGELVQRRGALGHRAGELDHRGGELGRMAVASPSPSALTSPWRFGSAPPRRHIAGEAEEESGGQGGEGHGGAAVVECAEVPQQELASDFPIPPLVRAQNVEVFIKTEQVAAARRLASDVVTATAVKKGQFEPGERDHRGGELVHQGGERGHRAGELGLHGDELDHRGGELVQCGGELGHRAGERGHHAGVLDPRGGLVQCGGEVGHRADDRGGELVQRGGKLEQMGDNRVRSAPEVLADLLDTIADNSDDQEFVGKLTVEVTSWIKTCAKLGVDLGDLKEKFEGLDVVQYAASSGGGGPQFP